nr:mannan endo-1,6-alpha-mannosidase dfg5 [Quercus suber]
MAASVKVAPFIEPLITPQLQTSALAAAKSCSGGTDGVTCGTQWNANGWDRSFGVGQQMCALEVIQGLLIDSAAGPVSNLTGGTSIGDPSAGTGGDDLTLAPLRPITTADRAGAGVLTAVVLGTWLGWYTSRPSHPTLTVPVLTNTITVHIGWCHKSFLANGHCFHDMPRFGCISQQRRRFSG